MRITRTSIMVDHQDKALKFHTQKPTGMGPVWIAVCADTCGNLIQLYQPSSPAR